MKAEWVDLQINGYAGVDFNAPGLTVDQVVAVTERLDQDGTVGYLPTIVTGDPETAVATLRSDFERSAVAEEILSKRLKRIKTAPNCSSKSRSESRSGS